MADETEDTASPAVKAGRRELFILQNIFHVISETGVRGREAALCVETLDYVGKTIESKENALNSLIATETLGRPVQMEGSVLSVVPDKATH